MNNEKTNKQDNKDPNTSPEQNESVNIDPNSKTAELTDEDLTKVSGGISVTTNNNRINTGFASGAPGSGGA